MSSEPEIAETHPSWAKIAVSRIQSTGTNLFDSSIQHREYVVVRIGTARRQRRHHHDYITTVGGDNIVEVAMSMAQWGAFVSSFNHGDGVPCTITVRDGATVEQEVDPESRLAVTAQEVADKTRQGIAEIMAAAAAVKEAASTGKKGPLNAALHDLDCAIGNLPSNMRFAANSLTEHAETVVTKARFDIEAAVAQHAATLGITAPPAVNLQLATAPVDAASQTAGEPAPRWDPDGPAWLRNFTDPDPCDDDDDEDDEPGNN